MNCNRCNFWKIGFGSFLLMRILRLERTPVARSCTFSQPSPKCFHLHLTKIFSKFCTSFRPFMGVCLSCCFSSDDMFSGIHQLINPPLSHGKTRLGLNRWRASRAKPTLITALVSPQVPPLHTNMCHLLISLEINNSYSCFFNLEPSPCRSACTEQWARIVTLRFSPQTHVPV